MRVWGMYRYGSKDYRMDHIYIYIYLSIYRICQVLILSFPIAPRYPRQRCPCGKHIPNDPQCQNLVVQAIPNWDSLFSDLPHLYFWYHIIIGLKNAGLPLH